MSLPPLLRDSEHSSLCPRRFCVVSGFEIGSLCFKAGTLPVKIDTMPMEPAPAPGTTPSTPGPAPGAPVLWQAAQTRDPSTQGGCSRCKFVSSRTTWAVTVRPYLKITQNKEERPRILLLGVSPCVELYCYHAREPPGWSAPFCPQPHWKQAELGGLLAGPPALPLSECRVLPGLYVCCRLLFLVLKITGLVLFCFTSQH